MKLGTVKRLVITYLKLFGTVTSYKIFVYTVKIQLQCQGKLGYDERRKTKIHLVHGINYNI